MWIGIVLTALVAMLITMAQHWFPWQEFLQKDLPRPAAYVLGTLAILLPATVLVAIEPRFDQFLAILSVWAAAAGAGLGTILGYVVDNLLHMRGRLKAAETESQLLRPGVDDAETER
jgi:hypothetical protein